MADETPDSTSRFGESSTPRTGRLWSWLPWVLVVLLAISTTWLAVRPGPRPAEQPPQPAPDAAPVATTPPPAPPRPRLEPWPDGVSAAEILGYSKVHAYRWSGGILTGWVEFDDGPKPRRVAIDLNEVIARNSKRDPGEYSGQVILARRQDAKGPGQEYWVWVRVEWDVVTKEMKGREAHSLVYHGPWKARGDTEGRITTDTAVMFHTKPMGEPLNVGDESQWLELRVGTPKKNAK